MINNFEYEIIMLFFMGESLNNFHYINNVIFIDKIKTNIKKKFLF